MVVAPDSPSNGSPFHFALCTDHFSLGTRPNYLNRHSRTTTAGNSSWTGSQSPGRNPPRRDLRSGSWAGRETDHDPQEPAQSAVRGADRELDLQRMNGQAAHPPRQTAPRVVIQSATRDHPDGFRDTNRADVHRGRDLRKFNRRDGFPICQHSTIANAVATVVVGVGHGGSGRRLRAMGATATAALGDSLDRLQPGGLCRASKRASHQTADHQECDQ